MSPAVDEAVARGRALKVRRARAAARRRRRAALTVARARTSPTPTQDEGNRHFAAGDWIGAITFYHDVRPSCYLAHAHAHVCDDSARTRARTHARTRARTHARTRTRTHARTHKALNNVTGLDVSSLRALSPTTPPPISAEQLAAIDSVCMSCWSNLAGAHRARTAT